MGQKIVHFCDGCKKEFDSQNDLFKFKLETDEFWNGFDTKVMVVNLEFCRHCAVFIKETLSEINDKLRDKYIANEITPFTELTVVLDGKYTEQETEQLRIDICNLSKVSGVKL